MRLYSILVICLWLGIVDAILHTPTTLLIRGGSSSSSPDGSDGDRNKPFYALGVNIARQVGAELKTMLDSDEMENVCSGLSDSLKGVMTNAEEKKILAEQGATLNEIITKRAIEGMDKRRKEGRDAASAFAKQHGDTQTTASGIVYRIDTEGTGAAATADATVEVHYHGTLVDGSVFDSSRLRGEAVEFPLSKVIKGWQEAVLLLKEGGSATFYIPPELAYGDIGSPPVIPPGSTLIFEIELIRVLPAKKE